MSDFLQVTVSRPWGPREDPAIHIEEVKRPDALKGRPVNGHILVWRAGQVGPTKVAVVDGLVRMSLEDLMDCVLVKAVPPTFDGSPEAYIQAGDNLAGIVATILLNAANVVGIPEGQMH